MPALKFVVAALMVCASSAFAQSTCAEGEEPYQYSYGGHAFDGPSILAVCSNIAAHYGVTGSTLSGTQCTMGTGGTAPYTGWSLALSATCVPAVPPGGSPGASISCSGSCTVTHVVDLNIPILQLTAGDGTLIASAILAVWAAGFGVRSIARALNSDGESTFESDK